MSKFKNVSGLNQTVLLKGKKNFVRDGEVIEAISSFKQVGFEKVADAAPVTSGQRRIRKTASNETVSNLVEQLAQLKKSQSGDDDKFKEMQEALEQIEMEQNKTESIDEIHQKMEALSQSASALNDGASNDVKELRDMVVAIQENMEILDDNFEKQQNHITAQAATIKDSKEKQEVVLRRMEILKNAMQSFEDQLDELMGFEEEPVILVDDE